MSWWRYLITAMLTGAVVLARCILPSDILDAVLEVYKRQSLVLSISCHGRDVQSSRHYSRRGLASTISRFSLMPIGSLARMPKKIIVLSRTKGTSGG